MSQRIETDASEPGCRLVTKEARNISVGGFVKRNGDQDRQQPNRNGVKQVHADVCTQKQRRAPYLGRKLELISAITVTTTTALRLPEEVEEYSLPWALRMVSKTPADVVGLIDRGEIAAGKRADLIHVHQAGDAAAVRLVWRKSPRILISYVRPANYEFISIGGRVRIVDDPFKCVHSGSRDFASSFLMGHIHQTSRCLRLMWKLRGCGPSQHRH